MKKESKLIIIIITITCLILMKPIKINAETNANYSSIRMDVEQCTIRPNGNTTAFNNCVWDHTNGLGANNKITFGSSNGYLRKMQYQFYGGSNYTYPAGAYRIQFQIAKDPLDMLAFNDYYEIKIYGNNTSNSSGASSGLDTITSKTCTLSQITTYRVQVNCAFTTSRDLKYINISFEYYNDNDVKLYNTNAIQWESIEQFVYSTDSTGAINNQTTIIQNEFNKTNQLIEGLIDGEHEYTNDSETIEGQDEIDEMEELEQDIWDRLDFSGQEDISVQIDGNTSNYIWQIANQLREINAKIILLMTSLLGLGIIKMILNR